MSPPPEKPDPHPPNENLLQRFLAGEPAAIDAILNRYEAPVYRFFYFAHYNHDQAQDETAETFLTLLTTAKNFRNPETGSEATLTAFLFGIARNIQRRSWRHKHRTVPLDHDHANSIPTQNSPPPSHHLSCQQEYRIALNLIDQLTDPARQIMLLRYVEDLKISEIAAALSLPENTVKSHLRRSCEKLRNQMITNETPSLLEEK